MSNEELIAKAREQVRDFYKARTSNMTLPRTFALGTERPYPVTYEMVRY
jgi:hypothetical protein